MTTEKKLTIVLTAIFIICAFGFLYTFVQPRHTATIVSVGRARTVSSAGINFRWASQWICCTTPKNPTHFHLNRGDMEERSTRGTIIFALVWLTIAVATIAVLLRVNPELRIQLMGMLYSAIAPLRSVINPSQKNRQDNRVTCLKGLCMLKKALWVIIPFLLIFLLGLALLLRPHFHVPIVHVVNNFTRQEKTSQRSSHRHTVDYATVKVELDGTEHEVTVHDNTWKPLKPGDTVLVTRGLFGKIYEYKTDEAHMLLLLSATMGPFCLLLFWIITRRKNAEDRRERTP